MKISSQNFFVSLALSALLCIVPLSLLAQTPLVPQNCNTEIQNGHFTKECGFEEIVKLANNILKFMVYIAVPIAAIAFAWAGWLYLSSRGNPGQISRAHGIFLNVVLGLVIVLTAYLIVKVILDSLANSANYISIFNNNP